MFGRLLGLVAPARCLGCGEYGADLCDRCRETVAGSSAVAHAAALDEGPAANIVRAGKQGARVAARLMSELTVSRAQRGLVELPSVELITWVPHDPVRGDRRGYHLPELYARSLARTLSLPAAALLTRRHGAPQRGASRTLRHQNLRGTFSMSRRTSAASVLLVDDVCTTGATLEHAAACLTACSDAGLQVETFSFTSVPRRASTRASGFTTLVRGFSAEGRGFSSVGTRESISHDEYGTAKAAGPRTPPSRSGCS